MFEIIMNMPVRSENALVHRLHCSYPVESISDFVDDLNQTDFIVVDEWYPNKQTGVYENHGPIALNCRYLGKIKEWSTK
jgi:hypothetical protein